MEKILVVEDNRDMQFLLSSILKNEGYETRITGDGNNALKELKKWSPDLVLLDIKLPDISGMQILEEMKRINEELAVIILTAFGDIRGAVDAMKLGAFEYITKPFDNDELFLVIKRALHMRFLNKEVTILRKQLGKKTAADIIEELAGNSPQIKQVLKQVDIVAPTNMTVVIQGESGTGKELIAQLIHRKSERREKTFVAIDCGAIPETLIESELFGYEKGAFTGADAGKEGRFEQANSGTMFLDEITNLPDTAQVKFLRVIQEKKLQRLGGKRDINTDVRIIAATNVGFSNVLKTGGFRNDLFHRINEFPIALPSLRERKEDILFLARRFLKEANLEFNKNLKGFSEEAIKHLLNYNWPGNVRELKNLVKRAVLMANADNITVEHLRVNIDPATDMKSIPIPEQHEYIKEFQSGVSLNKIAKREIDHVERDIIKQALIQTDGNKAKAARILKIDRMTLYSKIKKYQIE